MKNFSISFLCVLFQIVVCMVACKPPAATMRFEKKEEQKDSIRIKEVDRIVERTVPGDTVTIIKQIECDPVTNKPRPAKGSAKNGRSTSSFTLDGNGKLTTKSECDSIKVLLTEKDREVEHYKTLYKSESTKEVKPQYISRWYDTASRWIALITLSIIIIRLKKILPI